jgi:hypothetical protein
MAPEMHSLHAATRIASTIHSLTGTPSRSLVFGRRRILTNGAWRLGYPRSACNPPMLIYLGRLFHEEASDRQKKGAYVCERRWSCSRSRGWAASGRREKMKFRAKNMRGFSLHLLKSNRLCSAATEKLQTMFSSVWIC